MAVSFQCMTKFTTNKKKIKIKKKIKEKKNRKKILEKGKQAKKKKKNLGKQKLYRRIITSKCYKLKCA